MGCGSSVNGLSDAAVKAWTPTDVARWVAAAGYPEHAERFTEEEICGKALLLLQAKDFEDLGLKKGPAVLLAESVSKFKASLKAVPAVPSMEDLTKCRNIQGFCASLGLDPAEREWTCGETCDSCGGVKHNWPYYNNSWNNFEGHCFDCELRCQHVFDPKRATGECEICCKPEACKHMTADSNCVCLRCGKRHRFDDGKCVRCEAKCETCDGNGEGDEGATLCPPCMNCFKYAYSEGCFDGAGITELIDGREVRIDSLQAGDVLATDGAVAEVLCIVRTDRQDGIFDMVELSCGILLSPAHPVRVNGSWLHAAQLGRVQMHHCGSIYNLVLSNIHVITINGTQCATLGHGFEDAAAKHEYFGTQKVVDDLRASPGWQNGLVMWPPSSQCRCGEQDRFSGEHRQIEALQQLVYQNPHVVDFNLLCKVHSFALERSSVPSDLRKVVARINGEKHRPPPPDALPEVVAHHCMMTNRLLESDADPMIVGAYCLWWVGHVHPFRDGNGRTARGLCLLVVYWAFLRRDVKLMVNDNWHTNFHCPQGRARFLKVLRDTNSRCGMCTCCSTASTVFTTLALTELASLVKGWLLA